MCGITGFAGLDNKPLLQAMCSSLEHRGPDDAGYYTAPGIGLGMRRLSIIDLKTGHQPISNETGDVWVVFNGEIYNYDAIRPQLQARCHVLSTTSDTETIVHLYEDYGDDFVQQLRGMFGIALWDVKRQRLLLARDRIGEKPLYYAMDGSRLYFGSEIKAILQAGLPRQVNPQAVCDFLAAGYVAGPETFYRGINKLPPGHMLIWEDGKVEIHRYWQHSSEPKCSLNFPDATDELSRRLDESVRLCLKSDVEVGAFLSGGLDSSAIVALMKKNNANVQTFSIGYRGAAAGFNELEYARKVATHLKTRHHELIIEPTSSMELLPRILWHYDEPHGEPTSVLVYLLCEFTRREVKVALSGTGGDEIFFGYPRHRGIRMHQQYQRLPGFIRKQLVERIIGMWPESTRGSRFAKRAKRFISGADLPSEEAYLRWVNLIGPDLRQKLITEQVAASASNPSGDIFLRDHICGPKDQSLLDRVAGLDIEGYLPEYQLAFIDRMSMAQSLEARSPLCDYDLMRFVASLPVSYRLQGDTSKYIFKHVARQWLPDEIIHRRKVGFDSPIGQWFKGELREFLLRFLSVENLLRSKLLVPSAVHEMIGDHLAGRKDYSLQLWSMITVEAWYRMYIEDDIEDGRSYSLAEMRGGVDRSATSFAFAGQSS
jgi:asparagine synthase (glutamine-hydrolysing)